MSAVFIATMVADHQATHYDEKMAEHFGSLPLTLLRLFQATSGGLDWDDIMQHLQLVSPISSVVFVFYLFLVTYVIMMVLTGACVHQVIKVADEDLEHVIQAELHR